MPLICSYDCVHLPTVNSLPDMWHSCDRGTAHCWTGKLCCCNQQKLPRDKPIQWQLQLLYSCNYSNRPMTWVDSTRYTKGYCLSLPLYTPPHTTMSSLLLHPPLGAWEQLPSQYHTLGSTTYSSLDLSSPRSAITTRTSRFSTWTFEFIGRLGQPNNQIWK